MAKRYRVFVSQRAKRMVGEHLRFLARVNKNAAKNLRDRFAEAFTSLETMPSRHPFFAEEMIPPNKYHRLYVANWFLVLYQIRDDAVWIDYVVDCRQDYGWLLK